MNLHSTMHQWWRSCRPSGWLIGFFLTVALTACSSSNASGTFTAQPAGFPSSDSSIALSTNVNGTPFALQVLHASDFEGNVRATQDAPRFAAVVNGLKGTFPNTLVLSSGDNYIPNPFYNASSDTTLAGKYNLSPGKADIEILNAIGIQAAALGNHEFDQGPRQLRDLIRADAGRGYAGTNFPYLSANLDFLPGGDIAASDLGTNGAEANTLANKIAKSAVITVGGQQIGIVGATTTRLKGISSPGDFVDVLGSLSGNSDQVAAAAIQPTVDALIASGINKVILLAHLQQLENEYELASQLTGVDVIIGGGSHEVLAKASDPLRQDPQDTPLGGYPILRKSASGQPVALVNTGANYRYVGRLIVGFDAQGVLTAVDTQSGAYATDDTGVAAVGGTANAEVVAAVQPIADLIFGKDSQFFGRTTLFLNGLRSVIRSRETNLGDLTADANLATGRVSDPTVVISIKNGGGVRAPLGTTSGGGGSDPVEFLPPAANPLTGKQEGQISRLDIESSLAFNNTLSLVTVSATELKLILENAVSQFAPGATPGGFPQIAGLAFSFDPTQTAYQATGTGDAIVVTNPGSRIRSLCVRSTTGPQVVVQNGAIVGDPDRTFRGITLNFLAGGGDAYPFPIFAGLNRVDLVPAGTPVSFTTAGSEQKALADFLVQVAEVNASNYPDPDPTVATRIQNLSVRTDTIVADCQ